MAARNRAKRWIRHNALPLPATAGARRYTVPVRTVRTVLTALADSLGEDGTATETYAEIGARAGYGWRTTMRTLLAAERNGYIRMFRSRVGKGRRPNRFTFQALSESRHETCQGVSR